MRAPIGGIAELKIMLQDAESEVARHRKLYLAAKEELNAAKAELELRQKQLIAAYQGKAAGA